MTPRLLQYLCDPLDKSALELRDAESNTAGHIISGTLVSASGKSYPIRNGVPRFAAIEEQAAVESFGDEWNEFNFDAFRTNWTDYTVRNTFGSVAAFRGKVVVDAGAGSGMQTRWISEAGAEHVIALELSHAVDGIMADNLRGIDNVDVVQCSIDAPPLRDGCIPGIVMCHNVIQHTRSVEDTARALWRTVAPGGEFVFNCYPKNDSGIVRKARLGIYSILRAVLSRRSFRFRLYYARVMAVLRLIPFVGWLLEKSSLVVRGVVPPGSHYLRRAYKSAVLNTFDCYGAHAYQHLKTDDEIRALVRALQPDAEKVSNLERYFLRPPPIGIALRLTR